MLHAIAIAIHVLAAAHLPRSNIGNRNTVEF
jgi:hypothetical protein